MEDSLNQLSEAFSNGQGVTAIILIVVTLTLIIPLFLSIKKTNKKNRDITRKEIQGYYEDFVARNETYVPSGIVSYSNNNLIYSRGEKSITIKIPIEKITYICPDLISEWFENRNYSEKEETRILKDIQRYLTENRICKQVYIISDEAYYENEDKDEV